MITAIILPACTHTSAVKTGIDIDDIQRTRIITPEQGDNWADTWGSFITYTSKDTMSTENVIFGEATIKPGEEIHPPHSHIEEEYLLITQGEGLWTIGDKTFPAKTGELMYARSWDYHGIKNTGTEPMKFIIWKWTSKGMPLPKKPVSD